MSLKSIALRDFVIVREMDLDLSQGFTVLTGETGAGKSILIGALQLVLGARSDAGVVREGAGRCEISAEFDNAARLAPWLEQAGLESGETLLLRRTIDAQGKSRAWINGSAVTATQLRDIASQLVDIHGQHAWQSLTRPEAVRGLLDAYANVSTETLSLRWQEWRLAQKTLSQAQGAQDSLQRDRERLAWQIGELGKLAPGTHEWEELNAQHGRLSNIQALREAVQTAVDALQEADDNATSLLGRAINALQNQEHIEPEFKALTELLNTALAQMEDTVHTLRGYARHAELEPQRLAELDERLAQWVGLARRYKRPPAELPELLASWQSELQALDEAADLVQLEKKESQAKAAYLKEASRISGLRSQSAPLLATAITQAMQGLGMQGGRFEVVLTPLEQPAQHGLEQAEFMVAGHSGSTPRPVAKVASGGELSRIALAIAVTTSQLGQAQTLIFDEVDSGVGGAVAETVGRLMRQLGQDRQVMAVTHLPQVAAFADHHLVVAKRTQRGTALSTVTQMDGEQRVTEIARMLGGERLSGATLAHAREMLAHAG
ncbi:DNA repair protein RecN [Polaromonas naphthalenivorans]|uniref:DNA repair protein RecN n=1 Tax=Polaromonas naphthalenivorans (strain CJ2) TaxID=365044 RepID=A1VKP6_POLNA|nr:DNA repair protein RecN [Polaromonas naphthalenivorans]ABM36224.1 DNA replication and repair protein RecN [Polaromonas naphthalenivorans CJ2]